MKAVLLHDYNRMPDSLSVAELPIPALKPGKVLIKITAAPINPSDLIFLQGQYGITKQLPVVPGFEGCGTVVESGGGLLARSLVGKRVACRAPEDGHGTWAEYLVNDATGCVPLFKNTSDEQGACLIVNPLTACALIDLARARGHTAFVQTAAAGALGLMIARLGRRRAMTGIHLVRRPAQVQLLKAEGFADVFDTSDPLFLEQLRSACERFGATIAFDAVGGELTQELAEAMPRGSHIVVYGALSAENCQINPRNLIFSDQTLEGFWLTQWMKQKTFLGKLMFSRRVQKQLSGDLRTHVQARFPLEQIHAAIDLYKNKRTDGKVLIVPQHRN